MEKDNQLSDEFLAAYLDGNTNNAETLDVLEILKKDSDLQEALQIALDVENDLACSYDVIPMMKMAAESGENICSVLCEAYVLHRRGIPFKENELLELAQQNHWLTPQGSPLHSIGELLAYNGLMVTRKYDASLDDIAQALSIDNDVLVAVDSDKLYPSRPDEEDAPNHAIVVTAIDSESNTVTIFDPQENSHQPIPTAHFEQAWKESRNYMVQVLQSIDDYEPHPISLDDIHLICDLSELREAIAENAHEVWAEARIREGWSFGEKRDDATKKHPDLIPYSALPDSEKEYDRIMAINTIKLITKLGFNIVKRNE